MTAGGVLVTGFAPFGEMNVNPSGLLAQRLNDEPGVVGAVLPVSYAAAGDAFAELVERHRPAAALCFGVAASSDFLLIERIAWNRDESPAADNDGVVRENQEIIAGGPTAYGCSLPIPELMRVLALAGLPVTFSDHAGGFVCNNLFYRAQHYIDAMGLYLPMAFIHVPPLPDQVAGQAGRRGLPLASLEMGVRDVLAWLRRGLGVATA